MRSRSAAAILEGAGFDAKSMDGGIDAYNGLIATGGPEAGMAWFPEDASGPELTALAWVLEDGTEKFYKSACEHICKEPGHRKLIGMLEAAEDAHKRTLLQTCSSITGQEPREDFPHGLIEMPEEDVMEGGVKVAEALEWAKGQEMPRVIELMMALEANALDLYIRMARRMQEEAHKRIFTELAEEERVHLNKLADSLLEI